MGARDRFGHFRGRIKTKPELNEIGVSIKVVKSTDLLMATMAHEMIYLYQHENGSCTRSSHNSEFERIAARVCRIHGFDRETFSPFSFSRILPSPFPACGLRRAVTAATRAAKRCEGKIPASGDFDAMLPAL